MKKTNAFFIAGVILLGLVAIYWLVQGIGLMINGATSGTYGLFIIVPVLMAVLLILSRKRTLLGGILIALMGILLAVYFLMVKFNIYDAAPFLLLMCVPLAISGLLIIEADWSKRRKDF